MKNRLIKYTGILLILIVLSPIFYTLSYYILEINPHSASIEKLIQPYQRRSTNHRIMERMAVQEEGRSGISSYVAHTLAVENTDKDFRNLWHLIGLHWQLWLRLTYSEQEQFSMWLALAPYGPGRGMDHASIHHFEKPFEELNCYQLAELVVMVRAPSMFSPGSERAQQRIAARGVAKDCRD
jgi:membrane carboxypeptidase/penicillin-binding protein PbpC